MMAPASPSKISEDVTPLELHSSMEFHRFNSKREALTKTMPDFSHMAVGERPLMTPLELREAHTRAMVAAELAADADVARFKQAMQARAREHRMLSAEASLERQQHFQSVRFSLHHNNHNHDQNQSSHHRKQHHVHFDSTTIHGSHKSPKHGTRSSPDSPGSRPASRGHSRSPSSSSSYAQHKRGGTNSLSADPPAVEGGSESEGIGGGGGEIAYLRMFDYAEELKAARKQLRTTQRLDPLRRTFSQYRLNVATEDTPPSAAAAGTRQTSPLSRSLNEMMRMLRADGIMTEGLGVNGRRADSGSEDSEEHSNWDDAVNADNSSRVGGGTAGSRHAEQAGQKQQRQSPARSGRRHHSVATMKDPHGSRSRGKRRPLTRAQLEACIQSLPPPFFHFMHIEKKSASHPRTFCIHVYARYNMFRMIYIHIHL